MTRQTILIKVGGGKTINWDFIAEDLRKIIRTHKIVLVHGANAMRDQIAEKLNHPTKTIVSPSGVTSVYTDSRAIDIFLMSYAGLVNKKIVAVLQGNRVNAVGLSGVDGSLWQAKRKKHVYDVTNGKTRLIQDNLTGKVTRINIRLIKILLKNNFYPVICPPAIDESHQIVNTDGDTAAIETAISLGIKKVVFLFEMPGLLKDFPNERSKIDRIDRKHIDDFVVLTQGRMKKKLLAVKQALETGIETVYFGDGRMKRPIISALAGTGTIIS